VTYVPASHTNSTWGKTREEAVENTKEAIIGYVEAAREEGLPTPLGKTIEITEIKVAV